MTAVISTILGAAQPLLIDSELPVLSQVPRDDVEAIFMESGLSQFFVVRGDDRVYIHHKSVADWLTRSPPYDGLRYRHAYKVNAPEELCCAATGIRLLGCCSRRRRRARKRWQVQWRW